MLFDTERIAPADAEELARRRVWVRVLRGIAADRRRRRRRASLAAVCGAVVTAAVIALFVLI